MGSCQSQMIRYAIANQATEIEKLKNEIKIIQAQIVSMNSAFHYLNIVNERLRGDLEMKIEAIRDCNITYNNEPL